MCRIQAYLVCHALLISVMLLSCDGLKLFTKCKDNDISKRFLSTGNPNAHVEVWLYDARFMSSCLDKYGMQISKNKVGNSCDSSDCIECMKPCKQGGFKNETHCKATICSGGTSACKDGCSFYSNVYTKANDITLSPPMATEAPSRSGYAIPSEIELKWPKLVSSNSTIYALLEEEKGMLRTLLLTTDVLVNVTASLACGSVGQSGLMNIPLSKMFVLMIIVVNRFGWKSNFGAVKRSPPIGFPRASAPSNIMIHPPPMYHPGIGGSPSIILNTTWDANRELGVTKYAYLANVQHGGVVLEKSVTKNGAMVDVTNSEGDVLKGSSIQILVTPIVSCIKGNTGIVQYNYEGCHTVLGYPPSKCKAPVPTKGPVNVLYQREHLSINCTATVSFNCTIPMEESVQTCSNCTAITSTVMFSWSLPPNDSSEVIKYYYGWSQFFGVFAGKDFFRLTSGKLESGPNFTSASYTTTKPGKYKFQVWPVFHVDALVPAWSSIPGEVFEIEIPVKRYPTYPPPTTAAFQGNNDKGKKEPINVTVGLSVLLFIVVILGIGLFLGWRMHNNRKQKFTEMSSPRFEKFVPPDIWEVHPSCIKLGVAIGEGAFGKVHLATIQEMSSTDSDRNQFYVMSLYDRPMESKGLSFEAAVKLLQTGATDGERDDFLNEIQLMKEIGYHKNIVNMLGCCTVNDPLCIVVEYMPHGDLLHFLRKRRCQILGSLCESSGSSVTKDLDCSNQRLIKQIESDETGTRSSFGTKTSGESGYRSDVYDGQDEFLPEDLLSFSWQIAAGMEYLSQKNLVHRDLAARNVLVGFGKVCKISDFGLTRNVAEEQIYLSRKSRKLPIKWMSLEAILCQEFTTKSDVWAYGIVLFEIVTLGGTPYPAIDNHTLLQSLKSGYRMEQPENCSDEVYDIMQECWKECPLQRPSFMDLRETIEQLICKGTPYVSFDVNESNPYYNVPSFKSIETDQISLSDLHLEADACAVHKATFKTSPTPDEEKIQDKCKTEKLESCVMPGMDNLGFERYVSSTLPLQHQFEISL